MGSAGPAEPGEGAAPGGALGGAGRADDEGLSGEGSAAAAAGSEARCGVRRGG